MLSRLERRERAGELALHRRADPDGPSLSLLASATFLVFVVAGGIFIGITGGGDSDPVTIADRAQPAVVAPDGSSGPPSQDLPATSPDGFSWILYRQVALPSSAAAGPREIAGAVAAGYERSPIGALTAAVQIGYRHLIAPGDEWRAVTERQVLPGPGRDAYVGLRERAGDRIEPGELGQVAGFRFVAYSPDLAVIALVSRFPDDGALQVTTSTVAWVDGDWKLSLQPDGSASPTVGRVEDLSQYIAWGGV